MFLAHHIGIEILGHEYSPEGFAAHAAVMAVSFLVFLTCGVGTVTICRWLARPAAPAPKPGDSPAR